MTEEKKARKNPDYSASAVNLTNPQQVRELLSAYHAQVAALDGIAKEMEALIPETLREQRAVLDKIHRAIRQAVDAFGSYQDVESGWYALKQRRESISDDRTSPRMQTVLKIVCMYCRTTMGKKDGKGVEGVSHSICRKCWKEHFPDWEYPEEKDNGTSSQD